MSGAPSTPESPSPVWERATRNLVRELKEPRGSTEIYFPAPNICICRARGHYSLAQARMAPEAYDAQGSQTQPIASFNDWSGLTSYDSEARKFLTIWTLSNARRLGATQFLVSSRVVAMGIAAANLATKAIRLPLVSYTNRLEFESALDRALQSAAPSR